MKWQSYFYNKSHSAASAWTETLIISLAAPLLGWLYLENDPMLLTLQFPWTLFAPLLVGLRYGFAHGFVSGLLLSMLALTGVRLEWFVAEQLTGFVIGLLSVGMLAGEFRDTWHLNMVRSERANNYRQSRLDEFTRSYHILKTSHDRLEQQLVGETCSLRSALFGISRELSDQSESTSFVQLAQSLLNFISEYCHVQIGAIYAITSSGKRELEPIAQLGKFQHPARDDALIELALKNNKMYSLLPEAEAQEHTNLLLACPFTSVNGVTHGVLAVREMPFYAFEEENLQLIAVLCGRLADYLFELDVNSQASSDDNGRFWNGLERAIQDLKDFGIDSGLVTINLLKREYADNIFHQLQLTRRGLDIILPITDTPDHKTLLILMPLTDSTGMEGYKLRTREMFKEQLGKDFDEIGLDFRSRLLQTNDTVDYIGRQYAIAPRNGEENGHSTDMKTGQIS